MKKQTHPLVKKTMVQNKDGSFYQKRWLYFKLSLYLDVDLTSNIIWKETQKHENFYTDYNFHIQILKKE